MKTVISASRRTDIPAFYMPWFMRRIALGCFDVVNPYNRQSRRVPAGPDEVHSIVFWSKNFAPFVEGHYGPRLLDAGYHLFINVTVNSENPLLEPGVPPLRQRIRQLSALSEICRPKAINWRFDPVVFYATGKGLVRDNLRDFETVAGAAADAGIERCITSFMDVYPKIARRVKSMAGFAFQDPLVEEKIEILFRMQAILAPKGIQLQTCCEKTLLEVLPAGLRVTAGSCVPNDLLVDLYGPGISVKRDTGQRVKAGCGCKVSVDVGSYTEHPCGHRCLYCYARPAPP